MPQPSKFRCPECETVGHVFTTETTPAPYASRMSRERQCDLCGAIFETREVVVKVIQCGHAEVVASVSHEVQLELFEVPAK